MEDPIRKLTVGLIASAALVAGLLLVRRTREEDMEAPTLVPPGETQPATLSLERIRAQGY
jgi:hypothetical protein